MLNVIDMTQLKKSKLCTRSKLSNAKLAAAGSSLFDNFWNVNHRKSISFSVELQRQLQFSKMELSCLFCRSFSSNSH